MTTLFFILEFLFIAILPILILGSMVIIPLFCASNLELSLILIPVIVLIIAIFGSLL